MVAALLALALTFPGSLRIEPHQQPVPMNLHLDVGKLAEPQVTKGVLLGSLAVLLASEALIVYERDQGHHIPTISQILRETGTRVNTVPFLGSVLVTHWWLNHDDGGSLDAQRRGRIMLGLGLVFAAWDVKCAVFGQSAFERQLRNPPFFAVASGLLAGYLLWPQNRLP